MKKLLFTLMTCAAIVSCSKSDVIYDDFQQEIGFSAVASNSTKSVAGYDYDPGTDTAPNTNFGKFDGVFPTEIDLYVFANASNDAGTAWDSPYFKNAKFTYNENNGDELTQGSRPYDTEGAYEGDPARYWPNVKTLKFAGYSDACGVDKTTATMDFATNTLTIPSYTQNNASYTDEGANDLMWFPCDNQAYSKEGKEVPAQMQHACSWITINVYGDDVTANNWDLLSLVVKDISHTGKVECISSTEDGTYANWSQLTGSNDEDYYNATTKFTNAPIEYATIANNFIVIPQAPTTLDVKYSYISQEAVGTQPAITFTETKNIPLAYDATNSAWQSGYHYIYNIKITATEILIDPYVENWTNYSNSIDKEIN